MGIKQNKDRSRGGGGGGGGGDGDADGGGDVDGGGQAPIDRPGAAGDDPDVPADADRSITAARRRAIGAEGETPASAGADGAGGVGAGGSGAGGRAGGGAGGGGDPTVWVPYEDRLGNYGWRAADDPDDVVFCEGRPPGGVFPADRRREPTPEAPLEEGERVLYETTDGWAAGRVNRVAGGRARLLTLHDDGGAAGVVRVEADGTGPRDVVALGSPVSDYVPPDDRTPTTAEGVAALVDDAGPDAEALHGQVRRLLDGGTGVGTVAAGLVASDHHSTHVARSVLETPADGALPLVLEFTDRPAAERNALDAGTATAADALGDAWEGPMFSPETAPLVVAARDRTGNGRTVEGYDPDDALHHAHRGVGPTVGVGEAHDVWAHATRVVAEGVGDEVRVYRGVTTKSIGYQADGATTLPRRLHEAAAEGRPAEVEHRVLESWTTDPKIARRYADTRGADDEVGVVVERTVPAERVALAAHAGHLRAADAEVVVAHDPTVEYAPEQIHRAEAIDDETLSAMALRGAATARDDAPDPAPDRWRPASVE